MLSKTFDILTPIRKQHRISRQIEDMSKFSVEPAKWVVLNADGRVENVEAATETEAIELCIGHAVESTNPVSAYEANDTKVGNVTTIAKPGTRIYVTWGDFNHGFATTTTVDHSMVGDKAVLMRSEGHKDSGTTTGNSTTTPPVAPFDFPECSWTFGSMGRSNAALISGETQVGVITDSDENGVEIRLIEPIIG